MQQIECAGGPWLVEKRHSEYNGGMDELREFYGPNAGYVLELYDRFRQDPDSVDPRTRELFASWTPERFDGDGSGALAVGPAAPAVATGRADVSRVVGASSLAQSIREYGHLAARLDPLGGEPPGDPELDAVTHGIQEQDLASLPASVVGGPAARGAPSALEAMNNLRRIYCDTTGYDYDHIHDLEERAWLREAAETGRFRPRMVAFAKRRLLERLTQVEVFEQFLHRTFPGQKRFSIEGVDMLVPMLDDAIRCQTVRGNREVLIGMAHRGRLNVLAHVLEKPYGVILSEFERADHRPAPAASEGGDRGWTGDVKYHLGARWPGVGKVVQVSITLAPNPSHLEFVNPVVEGMARAAQDRRDQPGPPRQDLEAALAILIHGDAAFPGEGVVAETLNLSRLAGYQTGGTIHIIVNNQVGFTTEPAESRSTLYAGDLAKGFEIPIVHVNADDPDACLASARLACAYRDRFHKDFLIDLVGYRRWGHNEGDEPAFTQPRMYEVIRHHLTVRQLWAARLQREGAVTPEEVDSIYQTAWHRIEQARAGAAGHGAPAAGAEVGSEGGGNGASSTEGVRSAAPPLPPPPDRAPVTAEFLQELNDALLTLPPGFKLNRRLERAMERRRAALGAEGGIDWSHAETLAYATILADGTPIRLTGQDVERGTFSQRHVVLHDAETGDRYTPLQALPQARASFAVHNSPLSECAPLGFEYGYNVQSPTVMVIWEAQFGDFVNAGQVIVDQFIVAARAKWRQTPGMVLLLPHGYEGQGPEHSSARLERFLQLAANDNICVANCTTAAQYFHLLRRQADRVRAAGSGPAGPLSGSPQPLIVMSPKSLLRHPLAASTLQELARGGFRRVIDLGPPEPAGGSRPENEAGPEERSSEAFDQRPSAVVTRLVLCSGKIATDLMESEARAAASAVALAKVEELYPFPWVELKEVLSRYPGLREVVWAQEEPENMGAWSYLAPRLRRLTPGEVVVRSVSRPRRASPAAGSAARHAAEQARIIAAAFEGAVKALDGRLQTPVKTNGGPRAKLAPGA
jgi:2-oxoglutarate dehydrogenase E1 component